MQEKQAVYPVINFVLCRLALQSFYKFLMF